MYTRALELYGQEGESRDIHYGDHSLYQGSNNHVRNNNMHNLWIVIKTWNWPIQLCQLY